MPKGKTAAQVKKLLMTAGTGRDARNFLMKVMADESEDMDRRIDCAKTLLPYQYAKVLPDLKREDGRVQTITFNF